MPDQQNPDDEKTVLVIETEVYSRVVGYFRPVSGWNLGKKQEFEDRVPVKMEGVDVCTKTPM
jgi:anaerobic ribonucleoside-triphosphate reductase